jgi:hypothetical protein
MTNDDTDADIDIDVGRTTRNVKVEDRVALRTTSSIHSDSLVQPYQNKQIKIIVVRDRSTNGIGDGESNTEDTYNYIDNIIQHVQKEIEVLVQSTEAEKIDDNDNHSPTTTLIVCPECYPDDFLSYLNIVHDIEDMIEDNDAYTGVVQLASFHPQYCFDGSSATTDPDNCTNQSPYPTFHLLREVDVSHVVDTALPNQDSSVVWSRNVDLLRTLHEELSATEFTSVLTVPVPPTIDKEPDAITGLINNNATPKVKTNKDLIFRVRQILRRFPIPLNRK